MLAQGPILMTEQASLDHETDHDVVSVVVDHNMSQVEGKRPQQHLRYLESKSITSASQHHNERDCLVSCWKV